MLKACLIAGISVAQEHILKKYLFWHCRRNKLVQLASQKCLEKILSLLRLYPSSLPRYPPPPLHCFPCTNPLLAAFPIISTLIFFCTCSIYGYSNPLEDPLFRHQKTLLMGGIKGINGQPVKQKLPITAEVLHKMQCQLHLDSSFDATFWAACLVAFCSSPVISQTYCHLPPHQAPPAKMQCSIGPVAHHSSCSLVYKNDPIPR